MVHCICLCGVGFADGFGGKFLYFRPNRNNFDTDAANSVFMLLGISVFCTAVALGLITAQAVKSCGLSIALDCLTIPLALAAYSILSVGLRIMRGMKDDPQVESYRLAGTVVTLIGIVLQLAAIVLAWPQPLLIIALVLSARQAWHILPCAYDFPAAHAGAMVCLAMAYLAGFYTIFDEGLRSLQKPSLFDPVGHA